MKKTAIVLTAIVTLFAASAFALDGDNVSATVAAAFKSDFSQVNQVTWKKKSDFYFAVFQLNNVNVEVAYDEGGELVGSSRNIAPAQIPLSVSLTLSKKYGEYAISEQVLELTYEGQTRYYFSVENDKQVVQLKCYSNGEIDVEGKTKKEQVKS